MKHIIYLNLKITFLLSLLLLILGCTQSVKQENPAQTEENRAKQEKMRRSMLFGIIADSRIETVSAFVVANEFSDMFAEDVGPLLFFAPTNDAFDKVESHKIRSWRNQKNGVMKSLLNNHIVRVDSLSNDLSYYLDRNLITLSGLPLKVIQYHGEYYLEDVKGNRALIGSSPLRMDNGYIHYLDRVMY